MHVCKGVSDYHVTYCWCHIYSVLMANTSQELLGLETGTCCTWMLQGIRHLPLVGPDLLSMRYSRWSLPPLQYQPEDQSQTWTSNPWSLMTLRVGIHETHHNIAYLSWWPAAREEIAIVIAMKRNIQNTRVAVKHFLSAVTMVNILVIGPG